MNPSNVNLPRSQGTFGIRFVTISLTSFHTTKTHDIVPIMMQFSINPDIIVFPPLEIRPYILWYIASERNIFLSAKQTTQKQHSPLQTVAMKL